MKKITLLMFLLVSSIAVSQGSGHTLIGLSTSESEAKNIVCPSIQQNGSITNESLTQIRVGRNTRKYNITGQVFPVGTVVLLEPNSSDDVGYFIVLYSKVARTADEDENFNAASFKIINFDCDNDGFTNNNDNCAKTSNSNQADIDNDGIGDVCDTQDNRDSDGDGVQNYLDQCPTAAGPSSNNGCPLPTGNPDLTIEEATIFSQCSNCDSQLSKLGSRRHVIGAQSMNIQEIRVKNIGNAPSVSTKISAYISNNSTLSNDDALIANANLNVINTNGFGFSSLGIFRTNTAIQNYANGNYFILLKVDDPNINTEGNENNNLKSIPITLKSEFDTSGQTPIGIMPIDEEIFQTTTQRNAPIYTIEIYNFQGQKVTTKEVKTVEDENNSTLTLPKGLYIIKSKNGDRKVFVD